MSFNEKKHKKSTFKKMTVGLAILDTDTFEPDDLIGILEQIPFNLININLTIKKSEIGVSGTGYAQIGFVNKFYANEDGDFVFDIAVFEKYAKIVSRIGNGENEDIAITTRTFKNKEGKITKIIGLDLEPVSIDDEEDDYVDEIDDENEAYE